MTFEEVQKLVLEDEGRRLELKKSTGELKDGMHSACALLNSDGGYLLFGITPKSLKVVGQQVTELPSYSVLRISTTKVIPLKTARRIARRIAS